jgi:hypothetical protein
VELRRVVRGCPDEGCNGRVIFGDAAGYGGDPDGCRSSVYGGAAVPGGRSVLYASPSRWLTLEAYFGV